MKKAVLFSAVLFLVGTLTVSAQTGRNDIQLKSKPVTAGATNPNIKSGKPTTDDVAKERPKQGGYGSGSCRVELKNYTSYCIDIYVDGYWEGSLAAYNDAYVMTGSGYTTVYGISCGGTTEWQFSGASCYGSYSFSFY